MQKTLTAITLAAMVVGFPLAFGSETEVVDLPHTWILIIAPSCDFAVSDDLRVRLNYNNTGYEQFLNPRYEVSCFRADIADLESSTVPLLRSVFPADTFVFAYADSQVRDYKLYASGKYGIEFAKVPLGNADVELGYAVAPLNAHPVIQHERTHVETCSAHLAGSNHNDAATWTKIRSEAWCL